MARVPGRARRRRQLYRLAVQGIETGAAASLDEADGRSRAEPEQLTTQPAGIAEWSLVSGRPRIYFSTPDRVDADEKARREKRFTVNIRNAETPTTSLWALDLDPHRPMRLTQEGNYSVSDVTVSDDGKWVGFRGNSTNRYQRNITQANLYSDLYVLEAATGEIERLTNNPEAGESGPSFSPDGRWVAFSGSDDLTKYGMTNTRVYIRAVGDRGRPFRKLEGGFDGDVTIGFWSNDGNTIYFNEGIRATNQLFAIDVSQNEVRQITREPGRSRSPAMTTAAPLSSRSPTAERRRRCSRCRRSSGSRSDPRGCN